MLRLVCNAETYIPREPFFKVVDPISAAVAAEATEKVATIANAARVEIMNFLLIFGK
jgi:hypothetical protein